MSKEPRRKVYEIQSQLYDTYGSLYIDVTALKERCNYLSSHNHQDEECDGNAAIIRLYAGCIHDRDQFTQADVDRANREIAAGKDRKEIAVGELKVTHVHCVINLNNAMSLSAFCKLFNIVPAQVCFVRRRTTDDDTETETFMDKAMYISHRRQPEKAQYNFSDIWCNFNYADALTNYEKGINRKAKSAFSHAFIKEHVNKIYAGEETISDIIKEYGYDSYAYAKPKFDTAAHDFEKRNLKSVPMRLTFVITGTSKMGKTPLAKLYACSLFPDLSPSEAFYVASDSINANNTLTNYNSQPVIIFDDWRAVSFITMFGRDQLFNSLFAVYPEPTAFNIKYGSVTLHHNINIITTTEPFNCFINSLAGEYTDKFGYLHPSEEKDVRQAYKRVWSVTQLTPEQIIIQINQDYLTGDKLGYFQQFVTLSELSNNVAELVEKYDPSLYAQLGLKKFPSILEQTHKQIANVKDKITDPALIDLADVDSGRCFDLSAECVPEPPAPAHTPEPPAPEQNFNLSFNDYPIVPD